MKDSTKKTLLITAGVLLCAVLIVGIAGRFGGAAQTADPSLDSEGTSESAPVVDIQTPDESKVNVQISADENTEKEENPGAGADSTGPEQTIQADPVKPQAPEPPTPVEENHDGEDVPEAERNTATPPTYTPEQTTVTTPTQPDTGSESGGDGYLPGFGYIESSGEGTVTVNDDMYESGEKIGIMD